MSRATAPTAVFRADANPEIGGGHVSRCLVLAEELARHGWRCTLALNRVDPRAKSADVGTGVSFRDDRAPWSPQTLEQCWPRGVDLLVVDHYDIGAEFERACSHWASRLMAIDDMPIREHQVEFLLDSGVGRRAHDYAALVPPDSTVMCGARYAMLRPQFARLRAAGPAACGPATDARRLLVCLGAADPESVTMRVLRALEAGGLAAHAEVVLGRYSAHVSDVRDYARTLGAEVRVDVANMAELMQGAEMAVASAGVTALELCCLGVPTLLLVIAENQEQNASGLEAVGAVRALRRTQWSTHSELTAALTSLWNDADARGRLSRAAMAQCDGLGAARVRARLTGTESSCVGAMRDR